MLVSVHGLCIAIEPAAQTAAPANSASARAYSAQRTPTLGAAIKCSSELFHVQCILPESSTDRHGAVVESAVMSKLMWTRMYWSRNQVAQQARACLLRCMLFPCDALGINVQGQDAR